MRYVALFLVVLISVSSWGESDSKVMVPMTEKWKLEVSPRDAQWVSHLMNQFRDYLFQAWTLREYEDQRQEFVDQILDDRGEIRFKVFLLSSALRDYQMEGKLELDQVLRLHDLESHLKEEISKRRKEFRIKSALGLVALNLAVVSLGPPLYRLGRRLLAGKGSAISAEMGAASFKNTSIWKNRISAFSQLTVLEAGGYVMAVDPHNTEADIFLVKLIVELLRVSSFDQAQAILASVDPATSHLAYQRVFQ